MTTFDDAVVTAVLAHMNDDHDEDNLTIARAFGHPDATSAAMSGLDGDAGWWEVQSPAGPAQLRVPWPGGAITERAEIRREVVAVHTEACARLGVEPPAH